MWYRRPRTGRLVAARVGEPQPVFDRSDVDVQLLIASGDAGGFQMRYRLDARQMRIVLDACQRAGVFEGGDQFASCPPSH